MSFVVTRLLHAVLPLFTHFSRATFCVALVPLPPFLLPSVSGGHVSALEITFHELFSVDFLSVVY